MTKTNIDYSKTIIYKIVCNDLNIKDIYVGHTVDFTKRKSCHKSRCINESSKYYDYKVYDCTRKNGNWLNWSMIEIEKYPCSDGNEARSRERYWMEITQANLNLICALRTKEELKVCYIETRRIYKDKNKDRKKEADKIYRLNNIDKIKEQKKQYAKDNREKINASKRIYDAKEYKCECGSTVRQDCKYDHFKTKKHLSFCSQVI